MPPALLTGTKGFWRKKLSKEPEKYYSAQASQPLADDVVTLIVIGCGQRGKAYGRYIMRSPDKCKVVAIAEPRPKTKAAFSADHHVDDTLVFDDWKDLLAASTDTINTVGKRLADAVIVAVHDQAHLEVTTAFAAQGYHILCEKPMSTSLDDCLRMQTTVKEAGIIFGMGHVMRYSPYSKEISDIVRSGALGELVNIVQVEPVGHEHFAHSYVRGNWGNESRSSFSLLTKSCHDIDIIGHWFSPRAPTRVSSFGSLHHFRHTQKPVGAGNASRCLECPVERDCSYSAKRIYLDPVSRGNTGWPAATIVDGIPDIENITTALRETAYGKCVYESDNDVCDHQVVNIEYEGGVTASFTMVAFTSLVCMRQLRMHFTHGEIVGDMSTYTVTDFRNKRTQQFRPQDEGGGHGGGDTGLIRTFVEAVKANNQTIMGTNIDEVFQAHLTVFAAEASRKEGRMVDIQEFEANLRTRSQ